jgi:hypothetical protein
MLTGVYDGKGVGCMSGDNLWGMRGVISWSGDVCCRGTLYFLPITSRSVTTLQNFGREASCYFQHSSMIRASSFVHGLLFRISGLRRSSTDGGRSEVSKGWGFSGNKRTQHKVPDGLIVKERPRQLSWAES